MKTFQRIIIDIQTESSSDLDKETLWRDHSNILEWLSDRRFFT